MTKSGERDRVVLQLSAQRERDDDDDDAESLSQSRGIRCNAAQARWPAQYIVDQNGSIVFSHASEGQYEEIERTVRRLLNATS